MAMEPNNDILTTDWETLSLASRLQWHTKLDEAEKLVETQALRQGEPQIWYLASYTEVGLWRWNYTQNETFEADLNRRMELLSNAASTMYNKNNPKSGWFSNNTRNDISAEEQHNQFLTSIVVLAYTELCYTIYNFRKRQFLKGAYHVRRSWMYFRECRDECEKQPSREKFIDSRLMGLIEFGLGMFHFGISLVPPTYAWIVKLLGFEADRDGAILSLQRSLDSRCPKSTEAALFLILMRQFFLDEEQEALKLLTTLENENPGSPVLCYMFAFVKRINGQVEEAIADFNVAIKGIEIPELRITIHYHLGYTCFLNLDYQSTMRYLEHFLENSKLDQFRPYASYLLGVCYWTTNTNTDRIVGMYKRVKEWVKPDQAYDVHADRKIREFFEKGNRFSPLDIAWIEAYAHHEARHYRAALRRAKDMRGLASVGTSDPEEQARILWIRGSCYKALNKFDKARRLLNACLDLDQAVKKERFTMAYSRLDLGEMLLQEKRFDEARKQLKKAKSYKDYDWANVINLRIAAAEQRLSKADTAST